MNKHCPECPLETCSECNLEICAGCAEVLIQPDGDSDDDRDDNSDDAGDEMVLCYSCRWNIHE